MNRGSHPAIQLPSSPDLGAQLLVETARQLKEEVARRQTRGFTGVGGGIGALVFIAYMLVSQYTDAQKVQHDEIVRKLDKAEVERSTAARERADAAGERLRMKRVQNDQQQSINAAWRKTAGKDARPVALPWPDVVTGASR